MKKLTLEESFDFYLTTLERCGMKTLNLSDEQIEHEIFEEFAIEYPASLSLYTRTILEDNGLIDENISQLSKKLQEKLLEIESTSSLWNTNSFKNSKNWREILELSDKIKGLIHQKWSEEEIAAIRGK